MLLCDALCKDKAWVLANTDNELPDIVLKTLNKQLDKRSSHIPLAYIRGKSEFYGRVFKVNKHTLVPRPETETMIELLNELVKDDGHKTTIVDVGTGSGCLAITAKLEHTYARVIAVDISQEALGVAKTNAQVLEAEVEFATGNLLEPLARMDLTEADNLIILANLPYVPENYDLNESAKHEPKLALFAGKDGLNLYREMFVQIKQLKLKPNHILTESLTSQHSNLEQIALPYGISLFETEGLTQIFSD